MYKRSRLLIREAKYRCFVIAGFIVRKQPTAILPLLFTLSVRFLFLKHRVCSIAGCDGWEVPCGIEELALEIYTLMGNERWTYSAGSFTGMLATASRLPMIVYTFIIIR